MFKIKSSGWTWARSSCASRRQWNHFALQEADWANSLGYGAQQGAVGKSGKGEGKDDPKGKGKGKDWSKGGLLFGLWALLSRVPGPPGCGRGSPGGERISGQRWRRMAKM